MGWKNSCLNKTAVVILSSAFFSVCFSMNISNTKEIGGILMVLGSAILYSFKSIIIKYAMANQVLAQDLIFWRILLALPLFWGTWLLIEDNHDFRLTKTELITVLYMGAFGVALPVFCSYSALKYINASVSVLVIFTYPAIVTVLSLVFLKEKIGIRKGGSVVITYLGLIMVLELLNGSLDYRGVLLAGLAAFSFATHQILAQIILVKVSQFKLSAYTSTVAVIAISLVYFPVNLSYQPKLFLAAGILASMGGAIPLLLVLSGIKRLGASRTSLISTISPVSTVFFAYVLLGEKLTIIQAAGMLLVILGVAFLKIKLPMRQNKLLKHDTYV